jgi:LPS-assembly lipoprotein
MWWFSEAAVGKPAISKSAVGSRPTADCRPPTAFFRHVTVLCAALIALPLSGCLQPLYAPVAPGIDASPLAAELQSIAVDEIPLQLGHYVRNELIFGLNGTGSQPPPRYRLMVVLRERVQTPILDTVTGRATSATVIVDAEYRLITIPGEVEVTKGIAFNIASYDRFSNRFSNVRAARDAEIRDARVIAESIRTRIATVMAARLSSAPPPVLPN